MEKIKVLIADDHTMFLEGIRLSLGVYPDIAIGGTAKNGEDALKILQQEQIDVALLDIDMPKLNGIDTCRAIKKDFPEVKILALTMHSEQEPIRRMIEAGAHGYVIKSAEPEELILAIRKVAKGEIHFCSDVALAMMGNFLAGGARTKKKPSDKLDKLSRREIEIIKLIAQEYTTSQIAGNLFISETTVETHRRNIIQKLGVKSSVGIIRYAFQNNMI